MSEKNICPGCGRHCDLNEPHCGRGEEYRRTGKMPEEQHRKEHHGMRMAHYHAADINDKLIINLRDLGYVLRLLYEGKASQKRILIILNEAERITQRDLTERLGIQPGSVSEILSKLESAGLILRTANEADRRTIDVCLTDTGRELAKEASSQRKKRHEEMFSSLSEEERQELLSLLERVCADWRARYMESRNVHGHGHHHNGCHDGHGRLNGHGRHGGEGHHSSEGHYEGEGRHGDEGRRDGHGHHGGFHGHGGN